VALSSPETRLRGPDDGLLPARRSCLGCGGLISAYAAATDRFCSPCAPLESDEPPLDPELYCPRGHLRSEFWVERTDNSRPSGVRGYCIACKREDDAKRDRSKAGLERKRLERAAADRAELIALEAEAA
jgi:hypothetical protein